MATSQDIKVLSVVAGETSVIYRYVSLQADGKYDISTQGERMGGIAAESDVADGDALAMVIPNGAIAKIEAGAAIAVGAAVGSDATGRAITHVSAAGDFRGGIALDAAGAAGDIIRIQFLVDEDQVT